MFERIIIDTSSYPLSQVACGQDSLLIQEMRLLSCFYLVSKEVVEVSRDSSPASDQLFLPFIEEDLWRPFSSSSLSTNVKNLESFECKDKLQNERVRKDHFNSSMHTYLDKELGFEAYMLKNRGGKRYISPIARGGDILMTTNADLKADFLVKNKKSAKTAILALAAAGIEVGLPRIRLNVDRREEYLRIKSTLEEERLEYLVAIAKYADEALDRLLEKPDIDTIMWAQDQAERKILPKVTELELALSKMNKSILKRLKAAFFKKGIPAVGSTLANLDTPYQKALVLHRMLEVFGGELARGNIESGFPEANYQLQLSLKLKT